MQFNIVNIKTGEQYRDALTRIWKGAEDQADILVADLNAGLDVPMYRKKVIIDKSWREREADKMYGEYQGAEPLWMIDDTMKRLIWHDKYNGWDYSNIKVPHFAIVSQSDPMFISYFPDEEKGMLNKRVKISPGKYLKKYFSERYSDLQIEAYANAHKEKYSAVKINWATTPEEISNVYKMDFVGFSSCMQKPDDYFDATIKRNPTFVYGAGDLSLAYVVNPDGQLTTRALVWRDKNKVGRVYGDPFILRAGLSKEGIETKSNNSEFDTFEGARLIKEFHSYDNKRMAVAPYIDGSVRWLKEDGDYLIIDKAGRYHAEWTDGMARPRPFCERQQIYVSETVMVNVRNADGTYQLREWDRYTGPQYMVVVSHSDLTTIHNNSRYYEPSSPDLIVMLNNYNEPRYYTKLYKAKYPQNFWTSDISGKDYHNDYQYPITVEGKRMTDLEAIENAFTSTYDNVQYLNSNKVKVEGAGYWHIDQARKYAHQMVEGDDTLFTMKKGFVFMGGKVQKKPKPGSKFEHSITYEGAVRLSHLNTFTYVSSRDDRYKTSYVVEDRNWYLNELAADHWVTNAPRDMFEPDELVG